ncbi:MAG: hypothetical protein M3Q07_08930 [Pseudobdellovibrionaceae bacterium]|nr:hypothetical protein [Pseudobdellovibrionaceae bacterium]
MNQSIGHPAINGAFDRFLDSQINIGQGIRQVASTSQLHLREFLKQESKRDSAFPRILEGEDFIGGSFGRHTKIWPLDDIDIYLPLNGVGIYYYERGLVQPFNVLSHGSSTNPLLTYRWADGLFISSSKVISGFNSVLKRHYSNTDVKPNGEAVSIRMSHHATTDEDGLGYDIVPCFRLQALNVSTPTLAADEYPRNPLS